MMHGQLYSGPVRPKASTDTSASRRADKMSTSAAPIARTHKLLCSALPLLACFERPTPEQSQPSPDLARSHPVSRFSKAFRPPHALVLLDSLLFTTITPPPFVAALHISLQRRLCSGEAAHIWRASTFIPSTPFVSLHPPAASRLNKVGKGRSAGAHTHHNTIFALFQLIITDDVDSEEL